MFKVKKYNTNELMFIECSEIDSKTISEIFIDMDLISYKYNMYKTTDGIIVLVVYKSIWLATHTHQFLFIDCAKEWLEKQNIYLAFDNKAAQLKAIRSCVDNIAYITNPINANLIRMSKEYLRYDSLSSYVNAVTQSLEEVMYRIPTDLDTTVNTLNNSYTNTDNWMLYNGQIYRCKNG